MENDLEKLLEQAGEVAAVFRVAFRETTGEDFDLESAVRHYPLAALGLAAGAGILGGWWIARRSGQSLPPARGPRLPEETKNLGPAVSSGLERVRRSLPNLVTDQQLETARTWIASVAEPQVKQHLDEALEFASEGKLRDYLQNRLQRWGLNGETRLDDPPDPD